MMNMEILYLELLAKHGESIEAVQKLINMGANLDTIFCEKSALYWAITNKLSAFDKYII